MTQFWFILSICFTLAELTNPGLFFFLALALGALATFFAQLHDATPINEYAYFFTVSAVMFALLSMVVKAIQRQKVSRHYKSNTDLLIGKTVEITEVIDEHLGYGKVDGEIWQVKLHSSQPESAKLRVGMHGLVVAVKGCHLQITVA